MKDNLTIGELSKRVDLPTKTIRYYEEIELIKTPSRAKNGYREYNSLVVEELKVIKNARDLGLPIAEIKKLMKGCGGNNCKHSKEYIQQVIASYLKSLSIKIDQMKNLSKQMTKLENEIKRCEDVFKCDILAQLLTISKGGEANGRSRL